MNIIKKGFDFYGKTTRKSFWSYVLIFYTVFILSLVPAGVLLYDSYMIMNNDPSFKQGMSEISSSLQTYIDQDDSSTSDAELERKIESIINGPISKSIDNQSATLEQNISETRFTFSAIAMCLGLLWYVVLLIPSIAITVRRLRDAGFHPAWGFLMLGSVMSIPIMSSLCSLALLVMLFFPTKTTEPSPITIE